MIIRAFIFGSKNAFDNLRTKAHRIVCLLDKSPLRQDTYKENPVRAKAHTSRAHKIFLQEKKVSLM